MLIDLKLKIQKIDLKLMELYELLINQITNYIKIINNLQYRILKMVYTINKQLIKVLNNLINYKKYQ
jgi:hypothetical protein